MNKKTRTKALKSSNNLKELLKEKHINARELAEKIGTSAPHMSRLINGKCPLTTEWLLKISGALDVPTTEVAGVEVDKRIMASCDDMLLGAIIGWLVEAGRKYKVEFTPKETGALSSFIYKKAVSTSMPFDEVKDMTFLAVEMRKMFGC